MYLVLYNNITGNFESAISVEYDEILDKYSQTLDSVLETYPESIKETITGFYIENIPYQTYCYKIINNEFIKRNDNEIEEIKLYGHILTEEERLEILLKPTPQEIEKAENTLEILNTLQEVGLI